MKRPSPFLPDERPQTHDAFVRAVTTELEHRLARGLEPGLHLVATPIGNMADITLRALGAIAQADLVFCEDTRQSLKLLQRYGIRRHLDTYHEHNAEHARPRILAALAEGRSVALISDAGTPLVSDPGYKLVRAALDTGADVHAMPGPSAALCALIVSGLPTDSFHFAGFLPAKPAARKSRISELAGVPGTLVLFEAVSRAADTIAALAEGLGPRPAAIARELTKLNETVLRGPLDVLAREIAGQDLKGEVVLVIGPGESAPASDDEILAVLVPLLATHSVRDASQAAAGRLGIPRRRAYDLAIAFQTGALQIGARRNAKASAGEREDETP